VKRWYIRVRGAALRLLDLARLAAAKLGPWRVSCPVCDWRFREFLPHGLVPRRNARCPRCSSLERQRLLYLYLERRTTFFQDRLRVLHFAPEPYFQRFGSLRNLEVVTADLSYPTVDVNLDITALPLRDGAFDVVLCSHVLEHVPDDRAAMREIHRVLKPGGWAVLMVPWDRARAETFEDPSVSEPADRERLFGQRDHVRLYGADYVERLEQAGFNVTEDELVRELDRDRYGLLDEPVHVAVKPGAPASSALHEVSA
jgi:SAM-dependent methyltransferase